MSADPDYSDAREAAAVAYEREGCQLFLAMEAMWQSNLGAQMQRRLASVESLAVHIGNSADGTLGEGVMMKAARAEVSPVAIYRNVLDPSLLLTAPTGATPPQVASMQPIRTDSLFNLLLKLVPGWRMAAATQTATQLLQERKETLIDFSGIAVLHDFSSLQKTEVSLLYFCTPVGFASIFPVVSTAADWYPDFGIYAQFLAANSKAPIGLGANEFCDSVCAALGAGHSVEAIQQHFKLALERRNVVDLSLLEDFVLVENMCNEFVKGLGLPRPSAAAPEPGVAGPPLVPVVQKSAPSILVTTLQAAFGAPQPRVKLVMPLPFIAHKATTLAKDAEKLIQRLHGFAKVYKGTSNSFGRTNWQEDLEWETRIDTWITEIALRYESVLTTIMEGPMDLTPEREVGERAVPFPTQRTVSRVVSDAQLVSIRIGPVASVALASNVVPRANSFALVVCGSTRIWKPNVGTHSYSEETEGVAPKKFEFDFGSLLTEYDTGSADFQNAALPRVFLEQNTPLLVFDDYATGTAHCNASLAPPTAGDVEAWFAQDGNVHMWLGNPNVSHYVDLAVRLLQQDSASTLAKHRIRLVDLQEIPVGVQVAPATRQMAKRISVHFGLLVRAVYQEEVAVQGHNMSSRVRQNTDPLALRLASSNLVETRRTLTGLYYAKDTKDPSYLYLSLQPAPLARPWSYEAEPRALNV